MTKLVARVNKALQGLMQDLSLDANLQTFESLCAAYSEDHRHHHKMSHIDFCLTLFDEYRAMSIRPTEVQLGIWFHDAIHNPMSRDNEAKNADRAVSFMRENDCPDEQGFAWEDAPQGAPDQQRCTT